MLHPAVQIDLIRRLHLLQNLLRPLALLLRENVVRLRRADRERAPQVSELCLVDERWMRAVPDVDFLLVWEQVPDDVLGAEAVADGADLGEGVLRAHLDQAGVDDRVDGGREVGDSVGVESSAHPCLDVEVTWAVEWDRVAVEEVRHQDEVAVGGELVGDELRVDELVADHVGDQEDAG